MGSVEISNVYFLRGFTDDSTSLIELFKEFKVDCLLVQMTKEIWNAIDLFEIIQRRSVRLSTNFAVITVNQLKRGQLFLVEYFVCSFLWRYS